MTEPATIRPLDPTLDLHWAAALLDEELGGRMQARRGELVDALDGSGLVAELVEAPGGAVRRVGLITWHIESGSASAEIRAVSVDAAARGRGIGRALLEAAHDALASSGVAAAWLVTTNDNEPAIRLYESLGYVVVEIRHGAVDELRRMVKPSIPLVGHGGVAMRDELELVKELMVR
jgi:ribosomal protein S18 acetylase RimI-like enzyme